MVEKEVLDEILKIGDASFEKMMAERYPEMICSNCKWFINDFCTRDEPKVSRKPDDHCSIWERIDETEEKEMFKEAYRNIKDILKKYMDMSEENYHLVSLWILGTYFHDKFETYPYLFFNAMKSSGKSRILKLISILSKDGQILNSLTEAVLFRTKGTLCIDEFESITGKRNANLRELLNTSYKKGGKVLRMRKISTKEGENQVVEEFNVFRPIVMCNIWGMENVLEDRCISIVLEKSVKKEVVKLIEDFDNAEINSQLQTLNSRFNGSFGRIDPSLKTLKEWNNYVINYYSNSLQSPNSRNTPYIHNTHNPQQSLLQFFEKIIKADLLGRDLELFFPLYIIANLCGELDKTIEISVKIAKERKEKDLYETTDIQLYDFISQHEEVGFIRVNALNKEFREFLGLEEKQDIWINPKWLGRALKRLNLVKEKKKSSGMLVILNIEKAREKILMFREPVEKQTEITTEKITKIDEKADFNKRIKDFGY